jgi:uncharacterized protein YqeY
MATIWEKVNNDLKTAMLGKQEFEVSLLRMLLAALKNKRIELFGAKDENLTDEQVIAVTGLEIKKRKDSAAIYEQGSRPDLAEKEKKEIVILEKYMPVQATDEEIEKIVTEIIGEVGDKKNFGLVMGQAMARLKGQADGNKVGETVKRLLI